MEHSSRRRRLGLVAIAVASLATAATTATMPSPDLSSAQSGSFTLTADQPVAWLNVAAKQNDALLAAGGVTTVKIQAQAQARDQSVLLIANDPTLPAALFGEFDAMSGGVTCPIGKPCGNRVRLTAILLDPIDHADVVVDWTASAEANLPDSAASIPAATLAVEVGSVQTLPPAAVAVARTDPFTIELGPEVPRAVRRVHLTVPSGASVDSIVGPGAFLSKTLGPGSSVMTTVLAGGVITGRDRPAGVLSPFADCAAGAPCEVDMDIQFDWTGGSATGGTVDWSLLAWSDVQRGASPALPEIAVSEPVDIAWKPTLTASASGHTRVKSQGGAGFPLNVTLDMSSATGRPERVAGLVRVTLRATLAPDSDPAARLRMSIAQSSGSEILSVGPPIVLYSRAAELVCTTQPNCNASFSVSFSRADRDLPETTVDWTTEVEFVPLAADGAPKGAELVISGPTLVP